MYAILCYIVVYILYCSYVYYTMLYTIVVYMYITVYYGYCMYMHYAIVIIK